MTLLRCTDGTGGRVRLDTGRDDRVGRWNLRLALVGLPGGGYHRALLSPDEIPSSVEEIVFGDGADPTAIRLTPNPARDHLTIVLDRPIIPTGVDVFDVGGRRLRSLGVPKVADGTTRIGWDLRDDHGIPCDPTPCIPIATKDVT